MLRIAGLQQVFYFASHSLVIRSSRKCLFFYLPHSHSHFLSLSLSLFTSCSKCIFRVNVLVVKCVSLCVLAFYIKYCVPDDFTKLYPGIMYFTLRGDRSRGTYRGYIFVGPPFGPTRVRISSRSVLSMCPPSAIHFSRNTILFYSAISQRPTHIRVAYRM